MSAWEALLKRERAITAAGLALLTLLAWGYIWRGAGMGMSALDMTTFTLFPHTQAEPMPDMVMPPMAWLTVVAMWWVMMVAMMTPSAAPLILTYSRVLQHTAAQGRITDAYAPTLFLVAGYLGVWLVFSSIAATMQFALQRSGAISTMMLWSSSAWLSASVLIAAGLYQLSPLKQACLTHCRGPVQFLTRHWKPGATGALAMGIRHGAWCVGCCWLLMTLLFVGGVMNLAWIALLAVLVLAEKVAARGVLLSRAMGLVLIVWGIATAMK